MPKIIKDKLPIHLIGWAIFFIAPILLSPRGVADFLNSNLLWPTIVRNLMLVGLFYLNLYYLTPVVLKRYGIVPFLLIVGIAVVAVSFVNDWIHMSYEDFRPPREFRPGPPRRPGPFGGPLLSSFLVTAMVASVSSSIAFWSEWNRTRELEQERALQKVASELAVLKLQVSPHFLFNTLNNIRWLIRSGSDRAEEAVVRLSQLLRYILYQTNDDKVSLQKEIENMGDLISLQKMRMVNEDLVKFVVTGDLAGKMITPLLFVPLVENFFKHGDGGLIRLEVSDDRVIFETENTVHENRNEPKEFSGIGIENVKKRLALHYPNKHLFQTSQNNGLYKLHMEILL